MEALVPKAEDLSASSAAIYARSGFTAEAVRKARRKGIHLAVPLADPNSSHRLRLFREVVALAKAVEKWEIIAFASDTTTLPERIDPYEMTFLDRPFVNWLHAISQDVLGRTGDACIAASLSPVVSTTGSLVATCHLPVS